MDHVAAGDEVEMDMEEQPPLIGGSKAKEKKKKGKGVGGPKPKPGGSGKWSAPVKGDHSIAVAAPEVAGPGDHSGRGGPGHTRNSSISSSAGTGLAAGGAKHSRSTPSPTGALRRGTPSPTQKAGKGGRSGSSSPRAAAASRSPSPGMPGSPSPPAPDLAWTKGGKSSPTTATMWRGGVAADSIASGVSKRRGPRGHTVSGGPPRGSGTNASRKQPAGKSKAQMSKSFDERHMQAIKNAFHAPDGSATRAQTQVPPPTMQSAGWAIADVGIDDASEDFVLDEELCSLHEESIHDEEEEMAAVSGDLDALSGDHSIGSSFTSGSALGTGAFLPVGKAHVMTGLEEWVAEAAEQKMMPVPQGKQRLDDLLSESEHYPSKNPEEIQIHPDMIGNNIWNRMKALEKLVELQRSAQAQPPVDGGGGAPAPLPVQPMTSASIPVHSMSVKDIEREILSLSDTYPPRSVGATAGDIAEQLGAGAEACTLQRQMSGGAAAPDAEMMIRGGGRGAERVAASPQSNGSKNFTNKMQVPRIDIGAINSGGGSGSSGVDCMTTAPTGIAAPTHVETGSSYAESDDGYAGSRDDDVEARLAGQVSQLKLPDSPSGSISSACKRPTYPLERMPAGAPVASVGGTGAGSVGVGGDFRSPRSAFSTTSSQAGSDSGGGA